MPRVRTEETRAKDRARSKAQREADPEGYRIRHNASARKNYAKNPAKKIAMVEATRKSDPERWRLANIAASKKFRDAKRAEDPEAWKQKQKGYKATYNLKKKAAKDV